jgi:hypothetical protein
MFTFYNWQEVWLSFCTKNVSFLFEYHNVIFRLQKLMTACIAFTHTSWTFFHRLKSYWVFLINLIIDFLVLYCISTLHKLFSLILKGIYNTKSLDGVINFRGVIRVVSSQSWISTVVICHTFWLWLYCAIPCHGTSNLFTGHTMAPCWHTTF